MHEGSNKVIPALVLRLIGTFQYKQFHILYFNVNIRIKNRLFLYLAPIWGLREPGEWAK